MNIDEMIAEALEEEFEERVEQCLADKKKHRFSLSYKLWERKTLHNFFRAHANTPRRPKIVLAAAAFTIVAALALTGGSLFMKVDMGRYSFNTYPTYSDLYVENLPSDKERIEEYYGLDEDSGRILDSYDAHWVVTMTDYKRDGKKLSFDQYIIVGYMGHYNTENTIVEPMSIFEVNDGFFIAFKTGGSGLFWIYDGYFFSMMGKITKEEAVDLARSIKKIELE